MSQTIAADPTAGALDLEDLKGFVFERVLMESEYQCPCSCPFIFPERPLAAEKTDR